MSVIAFSFFILARHLHDRASIAPFAILSWSGNNNFTIKLTKLDQHALK